MSNNQHPELEQLIQYMELPASASDRQTALHLASCSECRLHLSNLLNLREQIKSLASNGHTSQAALNSEEEKAIIGNTLSQHQLGRIKSDKQRLKAALYMSSQTHAMHATQKANTAAQQTGQQPKPSLLKRISTGLSASFAAAPRWEYGAIAATLMLAILLGFALIPQLGGNTIIAYNDNPVIVFKQLQQNTPGMGFFSDAVNVSQPYQGIQIQPGQAEQWLVSWPEVENANSYLLQLYEFNNGSRKLLFEEKTRSRSIRIENIPLLSQHRYEWKLSGSTSDQRRFNANGGFVVR